MRKLKLISLVLVVIMVVSMLPLGMVSAFAAETAPTKLYNANDFIAFMNAWIADPTVYVGKTVTMEADIDLTGKTLPTLYSNDGTKAGTVATNNSFAGTFDGQGHTLSGYVANASRYVNGADVGCDYGLFGRLQTGTTVIQNVNFAGILGAGANYKSDTSASNNGGSWRNGHLYGAVNGTLTLNNVELSGVTYARQTGGFINKVNAGANVTFNNCVVSGTVIQNWSGAGMGGFVSENAGTLTFNNCLMSGRVAMLMAKQSDGMKNVGGFVSNNSGTLVIDNSVMSGIVETFTEYTTKPSATNKKNVTAYIGGFLAYQSGDNGKFTLTDSMMIGLVDTSNSVVDLY